MEGHRRAGAAPDADHPSPLPSAPRGELRSLAGRVLELIARRRDGSEFPVELSIGVWETEHGRLATGILRDITERKRAEQLQDELEHANRLSTMGEMAASLAHELNQPLYAVVNYSGACVQALEGSGDTGQLAELLHEVESQATRAGRIVRRLHEFAQKRKPHRSTFDVNDVIRSTMPLLKADAGQVDASLRLKLADGLPCILADRIELQQVIVNLVHNAFEAISRLKSGRREVSI
ncbi:MAG: sensor histidine kinase, partial [Planctomycetota bacterium]